MATTAVSLSRKRPRVGDESDDGASNTTPELQMDPLLVHVGTRVAVYWQGEQAYFSGTITQLRPPPCRRPYFIEYDDGDQEWIDLDLHVWKLATEVERGPPKVVQAACNPPEERPIAKRKKTELPNATTSSQGKRKKVLSSVKSEAKRKTPSSEPKKSKPFKMPVFAPKSEATTVQSNNPFDQLPWDTSLFGDPFDENWVARGPFVVHNGSAVPQTTKAEQRAQAKPLTPAEIQAILANDHDPADDSAWVRRSVRQPCKSALEAPQLKALLEKLKYNDADMVVLKMKKYISDPNAPSVCLDAALDALEENTNCEALYIQNFNQGMRDAQVLRLLEILQKPSCNIWCLNIGETYRVQRKTWRAFTKGLKHTNVTHMYASEHTISSEMKDEIRKTIRENRRKHNRYCDPHNLDTIVQCTHCWWNPINAKVLRPYLRNYEHMLQDKEAQGLKGTMTGANLT